MPWSRLSRFFGDGNNPTFNRNPYNGYINPYYWVEDHPLLYGNNGSLDPGTYNQCPCMSILESFGDSPFRFANPFLFTFQAGCTKTSMDDRGD